MSEINGAKTKLYPNWQNFFGGSSTGAYDAFGAQPEPSKLDLVKAFNDIVYSCTTLIADALSHVPVRLYAKTLQGQARPKSKTNPISKDTYDRLCRTKHVPYSALVEEVLEHPILDLLRHCNATHNQTDLFELTSLYLDITGNAYYLMEMDNGGLPCELYLLASQYTYPERDTDLVVRKYKYGLGTHMREYDPSVIIHFRMPSLLDPYVDGYSPLRAAWQRVQIGWKELGYLDSVLSNQGRPDSIIGLSETMFPDEMERLQKEFHQRYRGGGNGGPLITDGKMSFAPLSWPPTDLAALQLYQVIKTSVCNVYHIPPELFENAQSSNRSTREAAQYSLAAHCLKPRMNRIVERLNERLVPLYGDDRLFLAADEVVPEDRQFKLQEEQTLLQQGVKLRNEVRKSYNLPETEWARLPLLPSGMLPAPSGEQQEAAVPEEIAPLPPSQTDLNARSQAVAALQTAYYGGQLPRQAAIANAVLTLNFTQAEAEALFVEAPPKQQDVGQEAPGATDGTPFQSPPEQGKGAKVKALNVPDVRQEYPYDCGAAATMAVCQFFGVGPATEAEYIAALGTTEAEGTPPEAIVSYLGSVGLQAEARNDLTIEALADYTNKGCPVICPVQMYEENPEQIADEQAGHWIIVCGADDNQVDIQDPVEGRLTLSAVEFLARWEDRDAQGEFIHFGICVSPPTEKSLRRARLKNLKPLNKRSPEALEQALKAFFKRQAEGVHARLKGLEDGIVTKAVGPEWFDLNQWTEEMYRELLPTVAMYYDYAAQQTVTRLGGDTHLFNVVQPNLRKGIERATLILCEETQRTTSLELGEALMKLREELHEGVSEGEVKQQLAERVKGVFDTAENTRAFKIAVTEASRMQHTALEITAQESGLATGKRWILSDDACELCKPLAGKVVPLGENFVVDPSMGAYADCPVPPRHPQCRCTINEVIPGIND